MNDIGQPGTAPDSSQRLAPAHGASGNWKFAMLGALSAPQAPRVFTTAEFQRFVEARRPGTAKSSIHTLMLGLCAAEALRKVSAGLYLNARCIPKADLTEAAAHIRAGAVISLHTVLGECGFLNNPSRIVMAVVPSTQRSNLGEMKTSGGAALRFYGLAERFFPKTDEDRFKLLQPGRHCDVFRPEAALLQWLYLARLQRSTLTDLPTNVDMSAVDGEHLGHLAKEWRLEQELQRWLAHASSLGFDEQKHKPPSATNNSQVNLGVEMGADDLQIDVRTTAEDARARMMAKRKPSP